MYCRNCGNKVDENAYVCVNCGVLLQKDNNYVRRKVVNNNNSVTGIISIVFASISLFFCLCGFICGDISSAGMYTTVFERISFALGYNIFQLFFATISFILSLTKIKVKYNKVGLFLTLVDFFLILTEFVVIIIY
ncbi:MAG: hypothetical protein ACI31S_05885 [Bacilli bacterium]